MLQPRAPGCELVRRSRIHTRLLASRHHDAPHPRRDVNASGCGSAAGSIISTTTSSCRPPSGHRPGTPRHQPVPALQTHRREAPGPPDGVTSDFHSENSERDGFVPLPRPVIDHPFPGLYYSPHTSFRNKKTLSLNGCRIQRMEKTL